jgi:hypothetical protein
VFHLFFFKSKFVRIIIHFSKFLYNRILTQFDSPLTIVTNQNTHFINDVICYLTNHFILKQNQFQCLLSTRNGQVDSTNKAFSTSFTKLVNENWNDWDEHMSTILFSYKTTSKVGTGYTLIQLVYGLHSLLLT